MLSPAEAFSSIHLQHPAVRLQPALQPAVPRLSWQHQGQRRSSAKAGEEEKSFQVGAFVSALVVMAYRRHRRQDVLHLGRCRRYATPVVEEAQQELTDEEVEEEEEEEDEGEEEQQAEAVAEKSEFFCEVCKVGFSSSEDLEEHYRGLSHEWALWRKEQEQKYPEREEFSQEPKNNDLDASDVVRLALGISAPGDEENDALPKEGVDPLTLLRQNLGITGNEEVDLTAGVGEDDDEAQEEQVDPLADLRSLLSLSGEPRPYDVLQDAAYAGGAEDYVEALKLFENSKAIITVDNFITLLDTLESRVPAPLAMIRATLNLCIPKGGVELPLIPKTFRLLSDEERAEQEMRLFQDCCPVREAWAEGSDSQEDFEKERAATIAQARKTLEDLDLKGLQGRVIGISKEAAEYFAHFMPLINLEFIEELSGVRRSLEKRPSQESPFTAKPDTWSEARDRSTSLELRFPKLKTTSRGRGMQKRNRGMQEPNFVAGSHVVLSHWGSNPLQGGAICLAQVTQCREGQGCLIVSLGDYCTAEEFCEQHPNVRVDSSANFVQHRRQMAALQRLTVQNHGSPIWRLILEGGVGGNAVDSWAAKMQDAVNEKQSFQLNKVKSEEPKRPESVDLDCMESQESDGLESEEEQQSRPSLLELAEEDIEVDSYELEQMMFRLQEADESNEFARLNLSQRKAVIRALNSRLTVVQGPPGTGKTHVSALLLKLWKTIGVGKVLVTSHNNVAVDNIAEAALDCGLNVVLMTRPETANAKLDSCLIDTLVAETPHLERYPAMKQVIEQADVVCATTVKSASRVVSSVNYGAILMDEAAQATEASALVPITHCQADRLVLVGDHCQLPASAQSLEAETRGITLSLFGRLVAQGLPTSFLDTQFRMHPNIAQFSSLSFYNGKLLSGVTPEQRKPPAGFQWPKEETGVCFVNYKHPSLGEEKERLSICNQYEGKLLADILRDFVSGGELAPSQIGIVTPYSGQVRFLRSYLRNELKELFPVGAGRGQGRGQGLEISSVDAFQGREKDLIIFSAVRSNSSRRVGFLADWRRLNVMLTRAKRGIIVVGDSSTLQNNVHWKAWIKWASVKGFRRDID